MPDPNVINAITAATQGNLPLQEAMLLGSDLESGLTTTSVGDGGTSFGPFQIHLPAHPGVTAAEARDPVWATNFMKPVYQGALTANPDPMQAAALTAFHAERPAQMYPASRVSADWATIQGMLNTTGGSTGTLTGSVNGGSGGSGSNPSDPTGISSLPWPFNVLGSQIATITPLVGDAEQVMQKVLQFMSKIWLPSTWVRVFSFSVGIVFILVGLFLFFTKPRTAINTVEGVGRTVASMVP